MARDKILRTTRQPDTRLQDMSALDDRIAEHVDVTLVQPVVERVETIESELAAFGRGDVQQERVELRFGGRSGVVVVQPEGGFTEDAIGQPVLAQPYVTEADAVLFNARIVNTRTMLVAWFSIGPAPATAQLVYLIG